MKTPRPYQEEAAESVFRELETARSTVVVMPTGTGKTVLFSTIANRWDRGRVLMIAHREELVNQMAKTVKAITGEEPAIEMAEQQSEEHRFDMFGESRKPKVVVASVQSLCRERRLKRFDPSEFGLGIVDECHHDTPKNTTYGAIRQYFNQSKWLGVTATPDRTDKLALGNCYETVAYNFALNDAIDQGWLVPIRQQFVQIAGLDFSHCRTTAGDLNQGDLDGVLGEDQTCHEVAAASAQIAAGRKTLIFCVSVEHARKVADIAGRIPGVRAASLCGDDDKIVRRDVLRRYATGEINCLVGCAIFTEGFDEPSIEVVVIARPTKSRALYTQMVGRGTRTLPEVLTPEHNAVDCSVRLAAIAASRKPILDIVDLVGNSGKHKLVTCADILGGQYTDAVRTRANANARMKGQLAGTMQQELNAARDELDKEEKARQIKEARERHEREERERRKREEQRKLYGRADLHATEVNPFDSYRSWNPERNLNRGALTEKQRGILEKNGYDPDRYSVQEARRILNDLFASWAGKGISPKQRETLGKFGESGEISPAKANVLFALLKARGWQRRDYKLSRDRMKIVATEGGYQLSITDPQAGSVIMDKVFPSVEQLRQHYETILEN